MGGIEYKIASFNMYQFNFRSDAEQKKDLSLLAEIISQFDIVAMQEVLTENVLKQLLAQPRLAGRWEKAFESPRAMTDDNYADNKTIAGTIEGERAKGFSKSKREAEGYAFLWNTDKFCKSWSTYHDRLTGEKRKKVFEPRIYNQYRVDRLAGEAPLARNPFYGKFHPIFAGKVRENIELRLINTHITYGDAGNAEARREEFRVLARQIYKRIHDDRVNEVDCNTVAYTIMLGDYNLNLDRPWTRGPYLTSPGLIKMPVEVFDISYDSAHRLNVGNPVREVVTVQDELSTLRRSDRENYDPDNNFANNYDHFTFNSSYKEDGICGEAKRINTLDLIQKKKNLQDSDALDAHRREISDHVPIQLTTKF